MGKQKILNKITGRHFLNLAGEKYGRWTIISIERYDTQKKKMYWNAMCDCGKEKIVAGPSITNGSSKSCGCLARENISKSKLRKSKKNFINKKFGRLVIVDIYNDVAKQGFGAICKCDCGKSHRTSLRCLTKGNTSSCGCLAKEIRIANGKKVGGRNKKEGTTFRHLFNNYKRKAKKRKIIFDLNEKDFKDLTKEQCFYCGAEPNNFYIAKHAIDGYLYNGVDRYDNSLGYIRDNCVPCCKRCNQSKNNMTICEFRNWLKGVYRHFIENKVGHN